MMTCHSVWSTVRHPLLIIAILACLSPTAATIRTASKTRPRSSTSSSSTPPLPAESLPAEFQTAEFQTAEFQTVSA